MVCEPANVPTLCAVWHLPGRELAGLAGPDAASDGLVAEEKEQLRPGKQIAFLRPIDFFDLLTFFLVVSIPFLVFPSVSQKTKCLNNEGQRYLLAVTTTLSRH